MEAAEAPEGTSVNLPTNEEKETSELAPEESSELTSPDGTSASTSAAKPSRNRRTRGSIQPEGTPVATRTSGRRASRTASAVTSQTEKLTARGRKAALEEKKKLKEDIAAVENKLEDAPAADAAESEDSALASTSPASPEKTPGARTARGRAASGAAKSTPAPLRRASRKRTPSSQDTGEAETTPRAKRNRGDKSDTASPRQSPEVEVSPSAAIPTLSGCEGDEALAVTANESSAEATAGEREVAPTALPSREAVGESEDPELPRAAKAAPAEAAPADAFEEPMDTNATSAEVADPTSTNSETIPDQPTAIESAVDVAQPEDQDEVMQLPNHLEEEPMTEQGAERAAAESTFTSTPCVVTEPASKETEPTPEVESMGKHNTETPVASSEYSVQLVDEAADLHPEPAVAETGQAPEEQPSDESDVPEDAEETAKPEDAEETAEPEYAEETAEPEDAEDTAEPEDAEETAEPEDAEETAEPEDAEEAAEPEDGEGEKQNDVSSELGSPSDAQPSDMDQFEVLEEVSEPAGMSSAHANAAAQAILFDEEGGNAMEQLDYGGDDEDDDASAGENDEDADGDVDEHADDLTIDIKVDADEQERIVEVKKSSGGAGDRAVKPAGAKSSTSTAKSLSKAGDKPSGKDKDKKARRDSTSRLQQAANSGTTVSISSDAGQPHRRLFRKARYFIIKSNNHENVNIAKNKSVWATLSFNEKKLNKAFKECNNVNLIFSVRESGMFQGWARLSSEAVRDGTIVPWVLPHNMHPEQLDGLFRLQWIHKGRLDFQRTLHLKNPWNEGKLVKIGRDGQEVEPTVGEKLCRLFFTEGEGGPNDKGGRMVSVGGSSGHHRGGGGGNGGGPPPVMHSHQPRTHAHAHPPVVQHKAFQPIIVSSSTGGGGTGGSSSSGQPTIKPLLGPTSSVGHAHGHRHHSSHSTSRGGGDHRGKSATAVAASTSSSVTGAAGNSAALSSSALSTSTSTAVATSSSKSADRHDNPAHLSTSSALHHSPHHGASPSHRQGSSPAASGSSSQRRAQPGSPRSDAAAALARSRSNRGPPPPPHPRTGNRDERRRGTWDRAVLGRHSDRERERDYERNRHRDREFDSRRAEFDRYEMDRRREERDRYEEDRHRGSRHDEPPPPPQRYRSGPPSSRHRSRSRSRSPPPGPRSSRRVSSGSREFGVQKSTILHGSYDDYLREYSRRAATSAPSTGAFIPPALQGVPSVYPGAPKSMYDAACQDFLLRTRTGVPQGMAAMPGGPTSSHRSSGGGGSSSKPSRR